MREAPATYDNGTAKAFSGLFRSLEALPPWISAAPGDESAVYLYFVLVGMLFKVRSYYYIECSNESLMKVKF